MDDFRLWSHTYGDDWSKLVTIGDDWSQLVKIGAIGDISMTVCVGQFGTAFHHLVIS